MDEPAIRALIHRFYVRYTIQATTESLYNSASRLRENYSLSYWDSMIVAAALEAGAAILYTEDMQHGLVVAQQLTIVNPFKP